jgi:thioredoxin reductase (NADPH)
MTVENILIIGSGPAGLTAAIYAARAGLNPLLFEGPNPGGQLMGTTYVDNWPGSNHILGPQLMQAMLEHTHQLGTRRITEEVTSVNFTNKPFTVTTKKNSYTSRAVIIATGATPKKLGCPGEDTYWGKGVTTCAVCDGALYKDKKVIIVGGGDTAMENASFMTNFTKDITIVHILDTLTACHAMQEKVINNPATRILYQSTVTEIKGNGNHVTGVTITNKKTGKKQEEATNAVFIAVGLNPNTNLFKNQIDLHPNGYIVVHDKTNTSVSGIFVAGDVADVRYRQAVTSAATGCMAALDAERYLKQSGG